MVNDARRTKPPQNVYFYVAGGRGIKNLTGAEMYLLLFFSILYSVVVFRSNIDTGAEEVTTQH